MSPEQFCESLLLINGNIRPSAPWKSSLSALAIEDGRVTAHDEDALARKQQFANHNIVDLNGKTVLPGFTDSHLHLSLLGQRLSQVNFPEESTLDDIQRAVSEYTQTVSAGEWIIGGKWTRHSLGSFPDKSMLDAVAGEHPVALYSKDLHSVWLNTKALEAAQITADTGEVTGGRIVRNSLGEPTGVLQEDAMSLFHDARPEKSDSDFRREHSLAAEHCFGHGITSVHSIENWNDFTRYRRMQQNGQLQIRTGCIIYREDLDEILAENMQSGSGDDWLWLIGVKAFADGALGSRSAWMKHPYEQSGDTGIQLLHKKELDSLITRCSNNGLSMAVHAIGDAAVSLCLDSLDGANQSGLVQRIEHLQLIDPDDFSHLHSGLTAAVQPVHLLGDREPAEEWWGTRSRYAYAFCTLADHGINLAFGSDAPVEEVNPWLSVQAAVERRLFSSEESWYPEEKFSLHKSVSAFTQGAAHGGYRQQRFGSLQVGSVGDAIVLDQDPWQTEPMQLHSIRPVMTIVNGVRVYTDGSI